MNCAARFIPASAFCIRHFQCGAERRGVLDQQPVAGRHERDAAGVKQSPGDDARKNFFALRLRSADRPAAFWRSRAANSLAAARKFLGERLDLLRQPAPVEAVNGFDGDDFVQRFKRKRGLCAGAAVIVAAQAGGLFRRREADRHAPGASVKVISSLPRRNFRQRLAKQIKFEIWQFEISNRQIQARADFPFQHRC